MKMYSVEAYRSATLCRAFEVMELRHEVMRWGPYKRLRTAKRKRAELNKDRCQVLTRSGDVLDLGPAFTNVRVIENEV